VKHKKLCWIQPLGKLIRWEVDGTGSRSCLILECSISGVKVLKCNANIYFNQSCLDLNLIPKYAKVKIHSHSQTIKKLTEEKAAEIRIKNEIRFLYSKKQYLNKILYESHLDNANKWGHLWNIIYDDITEKIETRMRTNYVNLNNKLRKLEHSNAHTGSRYTCNESFHERTINLTNTSFTNDEMQLLNKGLKYNLHHKQRNWIKTIAIEADAAISQIYPKEQDYMRQMVAKNIQKLTNKQ
jgi:hypothetical protein